MAYVRSLREIPLDEEPHASVLAALRPDPTESPYVGEVDWEGATEEQLAHVAICKRCRELLAGDGDVGTGGLGGEED